MRGESDFLNFASLPAAPYNLVPPHQFKISSIAFAAADRFSFALAAGCAVSLAARAADSAT
ncbi:hypothetical protein [Micromonospora sp. DT231]|uniref:hypothetical protein n=1 Tax=Micromonospora sp. DT231 TaxID=3416526 RepID=UPI003CF076BC